MSIQPGASGYFSRPQQILDPQLFDGENLKPHVREKILSMFFDHMDTMSNNPRNWTMLWLAGSGISYQWSGDRGNGDLDVLLGLDYTKFVTDNPQFEYMTRAEIADSVDAMLKKHLWPHTSHTVFNPGGQAYEVTYYLNPYTENYDESIRNIHPYDAYNLTEGHWTIEPMRPEEYGKPFPEEFERVASDNLGLANRLVARYHYLDNQLALTPANTPMGHNLTASKKLLIQHIKTMFDTIHLGRKQAFSDMGEGYGDFYNFQWQAAKRDGIITVFNEILNKEN
jgi:hypothetical protein